MCRRKQRGLEKWQVYCFGKTKCLEVRFDRHSMHRVRTETQKAEWTDCEKSATNSLGQRLRYVAESLKQSGGYGRVCKTEDSHRLNHSKINRIFYIQTSQNSLVVGYFDLYGNNTITNRLFMAPHLIRAQSAYKDKDTLISSHTR